MLSNNSSTAKIILFCKGDSHPPYFLPNKYYCLLPYNLMPSGVDSFDGKVVVENPHENRRWIKN